MKRPSFQFYPKDFLADDDAASMTNEERGVYITLLCYDWENDGLEDNPSRLILRLAHFDMVDEHGGLRDPSCFENCKNVVLSKFIPHPDKPGYITNNRLYLERKKQDNYRHNSSRHGKRGGGNPAFKKGKPNPYYAATKAEKDNYKGGHKGGDKGDINTSSSSAYIENNIKEKPNKDEQKTKHLDFVLLSEIEFQKLNAKFGPAETEHRIERLNHYLGSTGKRYKSHYHTILSWATKDDVRVPVSALLANVRSL